jgi:hypothetical protein
MDEKDVICPLCGADYKYLYIYNIDKPVTREFLCGTKFEIFSGKVLALCGKFK